MESILKPVIFICCKKNIEVLLVVATSCFALLSHFNVLTNANIREEDSQKQMVSKFL